MKNQKGFSLPEILVAVAIMGGITVVTMKMVENQKGNEAYIKGRADIQAVISNMKALVSDPENCRSALAGQALSSSGSSISVIQIPLKGSGGFQEIIRANTKYPGFQTDTITLIQPTGSPANLANLEIKFRMKNLSMNLWGGEGDVNFHGDRMVTEIIPLIVTKNTSNQVTDCGPVVSEANNLAKEKFCKSLGLMAHWDSSGSGKCTFYEMRCGFGQVLVSLTSDGGRVCDNIENHINLNDLFDTTSSCPSTGSFSIIDNGSGKLRIQCN